VMVGGCMPMVRPVPMISITYMEYVVRSPRLCRWHVITESIRQAFCVIASIYLYSWHKTGIVDDLQIKCVDIHDVKVCFRRG
jgi:hypothetical protein